MSKAYFEKKIAEYQPHLEGATGDDMKRTLMMLIKEVDRDTRHKAAEMAGALHGEIVNLNHDR